MKVLGCVPCHFHNIQQTSLYGISFIPSYVDEFSAKILDDVNVRIHRARTMPGSFMIEKFPES